jgi:chromate transport protein ChrA
MIVLASGSLPYQPHTAHGYGWSLIAGLLTVLAMYVIVKWLFGSSGSSGSSKSSGSTRVSPGAVVVIIAIAAVALYAFGKSQDNSGTPPVHHGTPTKSAKH